MIRATFDRDRVDVAIGGVELAQAFARVRWDHLLYTGSTAVGREIAKAAAEQLVPVTLELGGKCPAIIAEDSIDRETVKQLLGTKAVKNGQMCISVDYCLVPRDAARSRSRAWPPSTCARRCRTIRSSEGCTGIISERHFERLQRLLDEAHEQGCDVRALEPDGRTRRERRARCRSRS